MSLPEYININGTNYTTAKLPAEAHAQVQNIRVVDAEIARLQQQLAIAQTARNAYSSALIATVKPSAATKAPAEKAAAEKKPRAPRKPKAKSE